MQLALCQYSFHRRWAAEAWDIARLCREAVALGVPSIDLHTRLAAGQLSDPAAVRAVLAAAGVSLAGLSFSNAFTRPDAIAFQAEVTKIQGWIRLARALGADTARIFGGHLGEDRRLDPVARRQGLQQVIDGLGAVIRCAEDEGVTLALENHGFLPGTSAEVLQVLGAIASPRLRATIDLGNFLQAGEEPVAAAGVLAPYGAYVHVKGMRKVPSLRWPWGWEVEACTPGEGDVDLPGCIAALRRFGFTGVVALEYEGPIPEVDGIPASLTRLRAALAA